MSIYTDQFGGVNFIAIDDEHGRSDRARISIQVIPGGNISYVDRGGKSLPTITLNLLIEDDSTYADLRALVGEEETLSYQEGPFTAILVSLSRSLTYKSGQHLVSAE